MCGASPRSSKVCCAVGNVDQSVPVGDEDDRLAFLGECDEPFPLAFDCHVWENFSIILFPSSLLASEAKCYLQLVERGMVTFFSFYCQRANVRKRGLLLSMKAERNEQAKLQF